MSDYSEMSEEEKQARNAEWTRKNAAEGAAIWQLLAVLDEDLQADQCRRGPRCWTRKVNRIENYLLDHFDELPFSVQYFFDRAIREAALKMRALRKERHDKEKAARKAERAARRAAQAGPSAQVIELFGQRA